MSPFMGEVIGTLILVLFGCGAVGGVVLNKSKAHNSGWIVISLGWGLGVAVAVYAVGSISGAHLNPAVTIGLASVGAFPWEQVPAYVLAQFIGAFWGAIILWLFYYPHWKETADPGAKLAVFATGPAIRHTPSNLISEMLATAVFTFGLLSIGANQFADGLNPLIIGFFIAAIGISLGGTTGFAINPARDLGSRIAHFLLPVAGKGASDWKYAWIPVAGPIIGGVMGAQFHQALVVSGSSNSLSLLIGILTAIVVLARVTIGSAKSIAPRRQNPPANAQEKHVS
ncbi:MIP/aquaporin family protein [Paenibacillus sp. J2TS4]|uniref:MIP/aquaporin family protein n=1 Tax=Paenibacillus sp. J2TS4 TaxID=2807194 RepID=UPI001B2976DF|nr:MIP/aquaporin family protein [Paenibacillus sp. J2TS4]GIP33973.1 glycerol uptake facilitator protein [Paenibacillus sp. J2TS4]